MNNYPELIVNGYRRFLTLDGIHYFERREPDGRFARIECEEEQLHNGDIEFMTENGITISPERKNKYIKKRQRAIMKKEKMKTEKVQTEVIFRLEKGGAVVAVFPYEIADFNNNMSSYSHIGQHSAMAPDYYRQTHPASEAQYKYLCSELTSSVGYNLKIIKRVNWQKYSEAAKQIRSKE